jgi:hypothetical protein
MIYDLPNQQRVAACIIFKLGTNYLLILASKYVFLGICALSPALAVKFNISPGRWSHFPLWPLFLQRDKGKQTEMTGTQQVGTLKT